MGRKPKEWQREPGWWSENFFAIRDLIWAIYFKVEEPDKAAGPSLDTLFRRTARENRHVRGEMPPKNGRALHWKTRRQAGPHEARGETTNASNSNGEPFQILKAGMPG